MEWQSEEYLATLVALSLDSSSIDVVLVLSDLGGSDGVCCISHSSFYVIMTNSRMD